MDRHPVHCAKEVKDFMIKHQIRFLYLPPYSPDLNPIENVFSKVNHKLKRICLKRLSDSSLL